MGKTPKRTKISWALHSQKRLRLAASSGFYRLCCKLSKSCSNSVDFIKLQQVCQNQTYCNLISAALLQVVETTCIKLVDKSLDNELAASLLTTCSRLVIIHPEQAMRTHPDIGLMMTVSKQACSRLAATCAFLAIRVVWKYIFKRSYKNFKNQSNCNNVLYVVFYYLSDDIIDFSYQWIWNFTFPDSNSFYIAWLYVWFFCIYSAYSTACGS